MTSTDPRDAFRTDFDVRSHPLPELEKALQSIVDAANLHFWSRKPFCFIESDDPSKHAGLTLVVCGPTDHRTIGGIEDLFNARYSLTEELERFVTEDPHMENVAQLRSLAQEILQIAQRHESLLAPKHGAQQ